MTNMGNGQTLSLTVTAKLARARGELLVRAPAAALPPAVERAAGGMGRMTLTGLWQERAEFSAGITLKSFGQKIVLSFEPVDAGTTRVVATSTPVVPTTVVDYGQGKADLAKILTTVAAHL